MIIRYTPKALQDLRGIKESILEKFESENIAERVLRNITTSINDLAIFPYKGVELKTVIRIETDYRYLFREKNYVFYRIGNEEVSIIRVLNEKQDYMRILFGISDAEDELENN